MNTPRLATRNRRHWREGTALMQRVCEDSRIDPREMEEVKDWLSGGRALGSVIDINDARGRSLNAEYEQWIEQLPEA